MSWALIFLLYCTIGISYGIFSYRERVEFNPYGVAFVLGLLSISMLFWPIFLLIRIVRN